jgi:hypothetical protein
VYAATGVPGLFGPAPEMPYIPLAIREMVLAAWLIARGFNPGTIAAVKDAKPRAEWSMADARVRA